MNLVAMLPKMNRTDVDTLIHTSQYGPCSSPEFVFLFVLDCFEAVRLRYLIGLSSPIGIFLPGDTIWLMNLEVARSEGGQ